MPQKLRWPLARLCAPILLAALSGCQTMTPSSAISDASFCDAARAIYYSRHDTAPTIAQIREHNAVGLALKCGWIKK
jgi:hypothetical protein